MFAVRLNVPLRSSTAGVRWSILDIKNQSIFRCYVQFEPHDDNVRNIININKKSHHLKSFEVKKLSRGNNLQSFQLNLVRHCSAENVTAKADLFGELSDRHFENVELDDDEKEEEKFVENEARLARDKKFTPGAYANLIKSHIRKKNYKAALRVLDLVAENRHQPTTYMYNLLLRAFAVAGDLKQSRSLYAKMKKHGLKCNAATYTSILNVCANYHHTETALDYLDDLRQQFHEKNIALNETHYNTMIKAYGRHGNITEALAIADLMRDARLPTGEITFNSLLIGAISDRDAGLRHALVIWHQMRRHAIKPTITTYNLLLRAIRDTELGDLKVNDVLISARPQCRITLIDDASPDLLTYPPRVGSLIFAEMASKNDESENDVEPTPTTEGRVKYLPAKDDSESKENSLVDAADTVSGAPLEKIHKKNRLILFGGVTGILRSMEKDGVTPDAKSMTLLMELVPHTDQCQRAVLKTARSMRVPLDIDFFNMLMKKRSFRKDYEGAKEILNDIQRNGLCPDIITWGILALGCHTSEDARNLIDGMSATGHNLNVVIAGTLINNACRKLRFGYVLEIMETMLDYDIQPNYELSWALDGFKKRLNDMMRTKKYSRTVNHPAFKAGFAKFNLRYPEWRKLMEERKRERRGQNGRGKNP